MEVLEGATLFDYLSPKDGPVFAGFESWEVVYAKNQSQYLPLRTLVSFGDDRRVTSRWTLTPEQRKAVAEGADIFLTLLTFGKPLQPTSIAISDDKQRNGEPLDRQWIASTFLDKWEQ